MVFSFMAVPFRLLDSQSSGSKTGLQALCEKVAGSIEKTGIDAKIEMRKAYVSLVRKRQFPIVKDSTKNQVDLTILEFPLA